MLILASSHISLIFSTRSLSNTLELLLLSLLLLLLATSSSRPLPPAPDWPTLLPLGLVCALGTFNRPTFILFAATPLLFWFFSNIHDINNNKFRSLLVLRLLPLLFWTLLPSLLLLLTDSLYFGHLTLTKLVTLSCTLQDWKLTPWNFLKFNLREAAMFGYDPW